MDQFSPPQGPCAPPPVGSHKKVIYFVRHAEAEHNVVERRVVQAAIAAGETNKERQDAARRAVLQEDPSLRDAPLSKDGTLQARDSGKKLGALFLNRSHSNASNHSNEEYLAPLSVNSHQRKSRQKQQQSPFRPPDVVLVSPLRRALMTATELFLHRREDSQDDTTSSDPPRFVALEALREKRTGLACDERSSVAELRTEFPHVDFSNVPPASVVPEGETNEDVRARGAHFLDHHLAAMEGTYLAIVSHKGWLREHRKVLKRRVELGHIRADFDINEWDTTLYGNAEVRVAAFRWQDDELVSVFSRSVDNAILASATMMGDGFEFALGPPSSGFSIFLANRTTKVHFISLAEGRHNVAVQEATQANKNVNINNNNNNRGTTPHFLSMNGEGDETIYTSEAVLLREEGKQATEHPLYDARLTRKGVRQAQKLRDMLSQRPSGGRPFTAFDLVIVSPLTRALETAREIFSEAPGTYGGQAIPPPRMEVSEECRERYGRYVCDGRRSLSELHSEFPMFDFTNVPSNEDVWYTDERESVVEVQARAIRLLESLSSRPERCIAVVSHNEFLRHLFGQFGDTLHEDDRSCLQRTAQNCELRSVVLCSHGAVEHEDADQQRPSTFRVPSSNSISSLAALGDTSEHNIDTQVEHPSFDDEIEVPVSF